MYKNPKDYSHVMKKYVREQSELFKKTHKMPGSAGFVVNSFMTAGFDPESGEIFDDAWDEDDDVKRHRGKYLPDAWNAAAEVEGIRRALNYRQCYISRMPYIESGAFWNTNPISKRKTPKLARKRKLKPSVYGGYDSKKAAYFFIFEAIDEKGSATCFISQMPIYLKKALENSKRDFEDYCRQLVSGTRYEFKSIVVPRLLKWQLIEISGSLLYVNAEEEVKTGSQLAFSQEELVDIASLNEEAFYDSSSLKRIYSSISRALRRSRCQMLADNLNLEQHSDSFCSLRPKEQKDLLITLLRLCRGNKKSVSINLSSIGGPKSAGRLRPMRNKVPDPIFIIDQSVTGMFERKTRVGL